MYPDPPIMPAVFMIVLLMSFLWKARNEASI